MLVSTAGVVTRMSFTSVRDEAYITMQSGPAHNIWGLLQVRVLGLPDMKKLAAVSAAGGVWSGGGEQPKKPVAVAGGGCGKWPKKLGRGW